MTERSVKVTQTQNPNREMPDKIVYWVPHGSILHLRKTVGAAMPRPGRGHSRPYAERGARQLNVTLADALRAGGGHLQSGGCRDRRRAVTGRGPKGSSGRGGRAAPPSWGPQQVHT